MRKTYSLNVILLCFCVTSLVEAQDIHFSQVWMSPLVYNPALAGFSQKPTATMAYRNQWKSLGTPYSTVNAGIDAPFTSPDRSSGFLAGGLDIFNDRAGESELGQLQATVSMAYHVRLNENNTLGVGLNAGYAQRTINYSNLRWGSQFDGYQFNSSLPTGQPNGSDRTGFVDIGSGIIWSYSKGEKYITGNDHLKARAGISLFHVNRPDCSFYGTVDRLQLRSVFYSDFQVGIPNTDITLMPRLTYMRQGPLSELFFGTSVKYLLEQKSNYTGFEKGKAISAGVYLRAKDAVVTTIQLDMAAFSLGLSYDFNTSSLKQSSGGRGGMEVTLGYVFEKKNRRNP